MRPPSAPTASVPLSEIVITDRLLRRDSRAPSLTEENNAFHALSRALTLPPDELLRRLLLCALKICGAGTAGISALEAMSDGGSQFRWIAIEGALKSYVGGTTPRHRSPCGYTLEQGSPQLFKEPARCFEYFAAAEPAIDEGLVVPIVYGELEVGTIWIVGHSPKVTFDMEDARVMESLAGFAGLGIHLLCHDRKSTAEQVARATPKARHGRQQGGL